MGGMDLSRMDGKHATIAQALDLVGLRAQTLRRSKVDVLPRTALNGGLGKSRERRDQREAYWCLESQHIGGTSGHRDGTARVRDEAKGTLDRDRKA